MRKSAESPADEASWVTRLVRAIGAVPTAALRHGNGEHSPLVHFHSALLETGRGYQLIHFRRGAPPHDPGRSFPIPKNARDELDLRMPRLIGVEEVAAWLENVGQSAQ